VASRSSYGVSSSILSSSPESSIVWSRPAVTRLNSRISDYSFTGNSIKEENEDDEQLNDTESDSSDDNLNDKLNDFSSKQVIVFCFVSVVVNPPLV